MDTPKITTEDRLHCVFCHRPMSETAFLRRKVASRQLRIVKRTDGIPMLGVCERCNAQFSADRLENAYRHIQEQFDAHKCKSVDNSQNALRIVREPAQPK
jgi:hypothetical protein